MKAWWAKLIVAGLAWLVAGSLAHARPPHKKALADYFGSRLAPKLNDCRTCHVPADPDEADDALDTADKPHNDFGKRLKRVRAELRNAKKPSGIPSRLEAVAREDSDGDGASNIVELLTGHYPGEKDDTPTTAEVAEAEKTWTSFAQAKPSYRWAPFEPVKRPDVPSVVHNEWVRNPIDAFVLAEHEARGLSHRPEAPREVLLRRAYLDLIGLPPTIEELHEYLADTRPDAYERVVDRLLAGPRYGERWGRHWMDVWRYSDWAGYGAQVRDSQPHIWHWRDWIIESLNKDKPYDRMLVEMLAADEAVPDDLDALRATGYLVRNYKLLSREKWMQDVVDHTSQAFLGVTLGCARCHDHMYDPFLQKEYYQVRAIFEPHNVRMDRLPGEPDTAKDGLPRAYDAQLEAVTHLFVRGDDRNPAPEALEPGVPDVLGGTWSHVEPVSLPKTAYTPAKRAFVLADDLRGAADVVTKASTALEAAQQRAEKALLAPLATNIDVGLPSLDHTPKLAAAFGALSSAAQDLAIAQAKREALSSVVIVEALEEAGDAKSEGWKQAALATTRAQRALANLEAARAEQVARNARRKSAPAKRAEADKALADAANVLARAEAEVQEPLTTAYTKRPATTYPAKSTGRRLAFARWMTARENPLAARVAVNQIWLRHFGQAIVPSVNDFGRNGRPPSHPALLDWLAAEFMDRGWGMKTIHRMIVTSNAYRQASTPDAACHATDPDNTYLWRMSPRRAEAEVVRDMLFAVGGTLDLTMGGPDIDHKKGLTVPRRSVYFQHAAEKQMEFIQLFDGPTVTECYRRYETTLPQQALALGNSELALEQSKLLAGKLASKACGDPAAFTTLCFEQLLARVPTKDELVECVAFLQKRTDAHPGADDAAQKAREGLVHVLLNHHEFVTIR